MILTALAMEVPTAKRLRAESIGPAAWYPYYAGYSCDFVRRTFRELGVQPGCIVLDPWNGAGTTTQVAFESGCLGVGIDLNPAVLYVAASRCCDATTGFAFAEEARQMVEASREVELLSDPDNPLIPWIGPSATDGVRRLIAKFNPTGHKQLIRTTNSQLTPERALHFVALYRAIRSVLPNATASNPTWIRSPDKRPPKLSAQDILDAYTNAAQSIVDLGFAKPTSEHPPQPVLRQASARSLPICSNSVDFVVTSPPYCTRIDYAVSTRLDLAVLGMQDGQDFRNLRDRMTGTSTIRSEVPLVPKSDWGPACLSTLSRVRDHASKASVSYYLKTFIQYFDDIFASLKELDRCCLPGAACALVVQDSFYKDVHVDLPKIISQMCEHLGWSLFRRDDCVVTRMMSHVNTRARKYRKTPSAIEASLFFRIP